VVPAVRTALALHAFFLDVGDLAACRHLAVVTDHAPAFESLEAEESYEAHMFNQAVDGVTSSLAIFVPMTIVWSAAGEHVINRQVFGVPLTKRRLLCKLDAKSRVAGPVAAAADRRAYPNA
jgi:hypothetical protein